MPSLHRRLEIIARLRPRLTGAALIATLPHASAPEREKILGSLLDLAISHPEVGVVRGILRQWRYVDQSSKDSLLALSASDLPDLIRVLLVSENPQDHQAARDLAVACARSAFLERPSPAIAAVAATLREAAGSQPVDACLAQAAQGLDESRSQEVLEALLAMAHAPGPRVRTWLRDESQAGHMPLRATARAMARPQKLQRATEWLGAPALRAIARQTIESICEQSGDARGLLERGHLLRARSRTSSLRLVRDGLGVVEATYNQSDLSTSARRGRIDWVLALPMRDEDRAESLARSWTDASGLVRLDAALGLGRLEPTRRGDESLTDFTFDSREPVARAALASIVDSQTASRRAHHVPLYRKLTKSSHTSVRSMARAGLRWSDPWQCTSHAGLTSAPISAAQALEADPEGFVRELRSRLGAVESGTRVSLFELAARVGVLERIEPDLIEAVTAEDDRIAAKVVLLLGQLQTSVARQAVLSALDHGDPRVRASAIESLSRQSPTSTKLGGFLDDDTPRIRANAIHHLARTGSAFDALADMLCDARPGHRISGLWVARRRREVRLASRVAELSQSDPAPMVRDRARGCARVLLAAMRHGWSSSAPQATIVTRPVPESRRRAS